MMRPQIITKIGISPILVVFYNIFSHSRRYYNDLEN